MMRCWKAGMPHAVIRRLGAGLNHTHAPSAHHPPSFPASLAALQQDGVSEHVPEVVGRF